MTTRFFSQQHLRRAGDAQAALCASWRNLLPTCQVLHVPVPVDASLCARGMPKCDQPFLQGPPISRRQYETGLQEVEPWPHAASEIEEV